MMYLGYYNDGKQNWQSHEISLYEDIPSHNPFDIYGYGDSKEEAIKDFKKKFDYLMDELNAFQKMLFETNIIEDSIKNVDCLGNLSEV